jgi:uncharacterized repeat protein (TIGR03803 family)
VPVSAGAASDGGYGYSVIHSFTNDPDGSNPVGPIIRDAQGNLYGTTEWGGQLCTAQTNCGTVFKVDNAGNETVLYSFQGGSDGANPVAGVVEDAAGNLYGTTQGNGSIPAVSTIFKLSPNGQETVLYSFGNNPGGCCANSPLILGADGSLYGTSPYDTQTLDCSPEQLGCGTVYELNNKGTFKVLHYFNGNDGMKPQGGLVSDALGNFYGVTIQGGDLRCPKGPSPYGCGVIFRLDSNNKETVLHAFKGKTDGAQPLGLIGDASGNFYGIASYGGDASCNPPSGCGTIFKVDPRGRFSVLYAFTVDYDVELGADYLVRDSKGNLYGANWDYAYRLSPAGAFKNLLRFSGGAGGDFPSGLVLDSAGSLIGTMTLGGGQSECEFGCGTVFRLTR